MESVALNYSTALFETIDKARIQEYLDAIRLIDDSLKENPSFLKALSSYSISKEEVHKMIDEVYGGINLPYVVDFLKVIADHRRMNAFKSIAENFVSLCNEALNVKEGICYSATKLSAKQLESIEKALEKKIGTKVHLSNVIDHNLLGGAKVFLDGKMYDGTLKSRLDGMRKNLLSGGN